MRGGLSINISFQGGFLDLLDDSHSNSFSNTEEEGAHPIQEGVLKLPVLEGVRTFQIPSCLRSPRWAV